MAGGNKANLSILLLMTMGMSLACGSGNTGLAGDGVEPQNVDESNDHEDRKSATRGAGGVDEKQASDACGTFEPTGKNCGVCELTLDDYCDEPDKCSLMEELTCQDGLLTRVVEEGCGFVRLSWAGDVGDKGVVTWASDSGELVYLWENGRASAGCGPETRVGVEPKCEQWEEACANDGYGGAGGAQQ